MRGQDNHLLVCGQSRAEKRWDRANSGENQGVRLMGGSQKSHIPSAAPLSPRGCDSWLDKPQRRTLLNKCYDHLRWEKLFIKTENELRFLCDSKDSFFWFCLFVYFCKNCKDLVYIIERGKKSKEKIHMFFQYSPYPLFLLYSQCGMVWVSLLLERKTKKLVRQNWQSYLRWIPDFSFF